ncbi:Retrovirus-related Pol polyprotein from transposon 17.6 [Gossypium australe]|uniref:Retrovirus-related Pol polyprotein from transposon 17.6 n=1 Tax=Gossypium australe TaxID=47621 RepID=A0A5B6URH9_9ROSI|nr:Retrovirus-related Pol polyprotein from transposon 17.6 [Gossypium australe]
MPNYVKFMNDILSKKRRLGEFETVALTEWCTTMLTNKLPPKLKDLGSFTIRCSIGNHYVGKALCDLGASINLMPMSVFRKPVIGKAKPTTVMLKIKDVLVRVDKFIFSANFIILECKADKEVPIILGRPFLATGRTLIDMQKGELTMWVNDQQITFNVFDAIKCADENEECHGIGFIDTIVEEELVQFCHNNYDNEVDPFELTEVGIIEELGELMETKKLENRSRRSFESFDLSDHSFKTHRPSIENPSTLELKPFPLHLKYAYLGDNNTLPIVISAELTFDQKAKLLEVLKISKKVLGWTIADINRIIVGEPSSMCTKKGGVIVVSNDNNELLPTRTITG